MYANCHVHWCICVEFSEGVHVEMWEPPISCILSIECTPRGSRDTRGLGFCGHQCANKTSLQIPCPYSFIIRPCSDVREEPLRCGQGQQAGW